MCLRKHFCRTCETVDTVVERWVKLTFGIWEKNLLSWPSQVALVVKNPPNNAGDTRHAGSIPGSGIPPGGRNGNRLQYSCLGNPMDRGAWWARVRRVTKSFDRTKQMSTVHRATTNLKQMWQHHKENQPGEINHRHLWHKRTPAF